MRATKEQKNQAINQVKRSFGKESHAKSLVSGILRSCRDETDLPGLLDRATTVVDAVRARGVTSFFAAEYGKLFREPQTAMATREKLMAVFEMNHSLPPKRAAKMADCIVLAAAKKQDEDAIPRLSRIASEALTIGFPFGVVADTVYYNSPEITSDVFIDKCIEVCLKKCIPLPE